VEFFKFEFLQLLILLLEVLEDKIKPALILLEVEMEIMLISPAQLECIILILQAHG